MKTIKEYIKENNRLRDKCAMLKKQHEIQIRLNMELDAKLGKRNIELQELKILSYRNQKEE